MDWGTFHHALPNVPRETYDRLLAYEAILLKWQRRLNLISPKDIDAVWQRHIIDCCQFALTDVPRETSVLDLGSGGGLPGIILAVMGYKHVTLVESDGRKCVFLEEVARSLGLEVTVLHQRIENITGTWGTITARGCAPLKQLLTWSHPLLSSSGVCLFAKGKRHTIEREEASVLWHYEEQLIPSLTADASVLIKLSHIRPHHP